MLSLNRRRRQPLRHRSGRESPAAARPFCEAVLPFTTANPANYNTPQQWDDLNDSHALDKTSGAGRYGRWHAPAAVCGSMVPRRSWVHCGFVLPGAHLEHASKNSVCKHATASMALGPCHRPSDVL